MAQHKSKRATTRSHRVKASPNVTVRAATAIDSRLPRATPRPTTKAELSRASREIAKALDRVVAGIAKVGGDDRRHLARAIEYLTFAAGSLRETSVLFPADPA